MAELERLLEQAAKEAVQLTDENRRNALRAEKAEKELHQMVERHRHELEERDSQLRNLHVRDFSLGFIIRLKSAEGCHSINNYVEIPALCSQSAFTPPRLSERSTIDKFSNRDSSHFLPYSHL